MGMSSSLLFMTSVLKSLGARLGAKDRDTQGASFSSGAAKVVGRALQLLDDCATLCTQISLSSGDPNRFHETILQVSP